MDFGIAGKNALVCGASEGMGRAIAFSLAGEGANVMLCARTEPKLAEVAKEINVARAKGKIEYVACDLADAASRQKLVDAVGERLGCVDILVHNTGGPKPSAAEATTPEQWQAGFDSLFQSVIHLNSVFVPAMKERGWGRIINVTSLSVIEPIPGLAISNAIRSAATAMLKTLSDELAPFGVTVNCVAPGSISTGRITSLIESRAKTSNVSVEEYEKEYIKNIPAGRLGTAEEFANVVCFLCSDKASYVTGSTISVDGGRRRSTY
jgi:3-oxoacyl-[acyl-carrier protein] reductase